MPGSTVRVRGGIGTISRDASRVARHVNIREIRLIETSTELKSFTSGGPFQWDLRVSPGVHYQQGDQFFVLTVGYQVTIERPDDSGAEEPGRETEEIADISFQFGMLCELEQEKFSSEVSREEVEEYGDAAAQIVFSPYVREYLHDVTMRMGLPPLVMDILPSFAEEVPEQVGSDRNTKGKS